MWQPLCHLSEVPNPGDFVRLGIKLVVSHFEGGLVKVWNNICQHRGAAVLAGDFVAGNCEHRCPYHGRLMTPENVKSFPSALHNGWVWADLGQDPSLSPMPMAHWMPSNVTRLIDRFDLMIEAPFAIVVENALEAEHVRHVHPGTLGRLKLQSIERGLYPYGGSVEIFKTGNARSLDRLEPFFNRSPNLVSLREGVDYFHAYIAPYTCVSSVRGFTYSLQHYFPRDDGNVQFIHRLYATPTTRDMAPFFASVFSLNKRVFQEDAAICERVDPTFPRVGHGVDEGSPDARIHHFRNRTPQWLINHGL